MQEQKEHTPSRRENAIPDGWFSTKGAAQYLDVSYAAIYKAHQKGRLEGKRFGDEDVLCFNKETLDIYDAKRRALYAVEENSDTFSQEVPEEPAQEPPQPAAWYAQPLAEDEHVERHHIVPQWIGQQPALPVGKAKRLELSSGGSIYLNYDIDLFTATEAERTLLFTLIDAIKGFEQ